MLFPSRFKEVIKMHANLDLEYHLTKIALDIFKVSTNKQ
ncbi:hypothetical protein EV04_0560 [Prochlorococcus marinus str. LG]|nr:hypothetical protein EV04_0560 [Prochlorococcus marinus str. LG]